MPVSRKVSCSVYAVIAGAALIATWSQNVAYVHNANICSTFGAFLAELKVNPASGDSRDGPAYSRDLRR